MPKKKGSDLEKTQPKDLVATADGSTLVVSGEAPQTEVARYDEVVRRAYQMWEEEGRPHGRDLDHWFTAEREMRGTSDE